MPVPQMDRMLSGHPEGAPEPSGAPGQHDQGVIGPTFTSFRLPFGVVFAPNLTPDQETGLGGWTEEQFVRALRTGQHKGEVGAGSRPILPPMPWANIASFGDEDIKAIYAYLRTVPAIHNAVPAPKVAPEAMVAVASSYEKLRASMK
jgi:hypothetical protein